MRRTFFPSEGLDRVNNKAFQLFYYLFFKIFVYLLIVTLLHTLIHFYHLLTLTFSYSAIPTIRYYNLRTKIARLLDLHVQNMLCFLIFNYLITHTL